MTSIVIETEFVPPSANHLFANVPGRGRVPSKSYLAWQKAAGYDFNGKGSLFGPFMVSIIIDTEKRNKRADLDNKIKATMDLLKKHGVIEDDRFAEEIHARWGHAPKGMRIEVSPARQVV